MSERTRGLPAYAVPLLLVCGGVVILMLALWPKGIPSSSTSAVTQRGGTNMPITNPTSAASLPQPYPSTNIEQDAGRLPGPILTPFDEAESIYPRYNLLVLGQPVTNSIMV